MTRDAILHHHKRGMDRRQLVMIYGRDPVTLALGEEPGVIAAEAAVRKARKSLRVKLNSAQYDMVRMMCQAPASNGQMAAKIGCSAANISKHVQTLRGILPAYGCTISQDAERRLSVSDRTIIDRCDRVIGEKWVKRLGGQHGAFDLTPDTRRLLDLLLTVAPLTTPEICDALDCNEGGVAHRVRRLRDGLEPHGFGVLSDARGGTGYRLSHPQEIRAMLGGMEP